MSSVCLLVCPSVCPSVTLVDNLRTTNRTIGKWKLIARTISLRSWQPKGHPPTPRGTWTNLGETRRGVGKMAFWSTKEAISLKRVKIEKKLLRGAYRNSPSLFRTVPSRTPYGLPFPSPRLGVRTPPKIPSVIISGTGKATNFKFGQNNNRVYPNKSP